MRVPECSNTNGDYMLASVLIAGAFVSCVLLGLAAGLVIAHLWK